MGRERERVAGRVADRVAVIPSPGLGGRGRGSGSGRAAVGEAGRVAGGVAVWGSVAVCGAVLSSVAVR